MPKSSRSFAAANDRCRIRSKVMSASAIDIITRSGNSSARRSSTAGTVKRSTPKSTGLMGFPPQTGAAPAGKRGIRPPLSFRGRRVRLTVWGVSEVGGRALFARVEAVRPAAKGRVVMCLFRSEVRLLQVFHVLPGKEVLLDDFLLQGQEPCGAAAG